MKVSDYFENKERFEKMIEEFEKTRETKLV